jgi:ribosomal protein S18 acetylase RimI-like enzyme
LAFAGNEFAGLVLFSPTNRNFDVFERPGLYIHSLYVLKQFRRQGIAKKLIDKIKEIAKKENYGRIDWVTLKSNNVGAQFYQTIDDVKVVDYIDYMRIRIN